MKLGMLNWENLGIGNFEFLDFRNRVRMKLGMLNWGYFREPEF